MTRVIPFPKWGTYVQIQSFRTFSKMLDHCRMCDDAACIMCHKCIGRGKKK